MSEIEEVVSGNISPGRPVTILRVSRERFPGVFSLLLRAPVETLCVEFERLLRRCFRFLLCSISSPYFSGANFMKEILVVRSSGFAEWLLSEGLLRLADDSCDRYCFRFSL